MFLLSWRVIAAASLTLTAATACAPPATVAAMVPDPAIMAGRAPAPAYRNAISLGSVSVGRDIGTPWTSAVGPDEVREALARMLSSAQLGQGANGRFRLDAMLLGLTRPYAGFAMTVTASIAYRLTDAASGALVYDKVLTGLGTATLDDAITNENRLRIADQRAVGANLQQLLQDLYSLPPR